MLLPNGVKYSDKIATRREINDKLWSMDHASQGDFLVANVLLHYNEILIAMQQVFFFTFL